jgi:Cys-tRNA(Pro)/Cys-tRNA(Cys) deacylase
MGAARTRALDELIKAGALHTIHEYAVEAAAHQAPGRGARPGRRPAWGDDAAAALGVDPRRIHKTLIVAVDGRLAVAVVAVAAELDLKAFADALGGRKAVMADPGDAERATGYVRGGISPLGQRRRLPTVVDAAALAFPTVFVSAGRRGLQVELEPADLVRVTGAIVADIARRAPDG